jgi:hypothetical protein
MIRFAAHHIFYKKLYGLSYIELDDEARLVGVFPLEDEVEETVFVGGTIFPMPEHFSLDPLHYDEEQEEWKRQANSISKGDKVILFRVGVASATKLRTDNGRCNGHVERL